MISKAEKKILDFIEQHLEVFLFGCVFVIGMLIRFSLREISSTDMSGDYLIWCEEISKMSFAEVLKTPVGNYSNLYQLMLFVITRIPFVSAMGLIKAVSCLFDLAIAILFYYIGKDEVRTPHAGLYMASAAWLFPIMFLNSAAWGQCDAIFGFFAFLAIYLLYKKKNLAAFIFLGVSFAWKLQAVLVLPIFIYCYLKRKDYSILYFLIIPVVMVLLFIPNLIAGRPLASLLGTYTEQVSIFSESLYINFANFYSIIADDFGAAEVQGLASYGGVVLAIGMLGFFCVKSLRLRRQNSFSEYMQVVVLLMFTCVMFLPKMHDRYGYLYEVMALATCFVNKKYIVPTVILVIQSLTHYALCLFHFSTMPLWVSTAMYVTTFVWYMMIYFKESEALQKTK